MADNKHLKIAQQLKADIAEGKYADRIPGIHALAKEYGVNFKTANKAMADLEDEGLLHTRRGEGRFVTPGGASVGRKQVTLLVKTEGHFHEVLATSLVREVQAAGFLPVLLDPEHLEGSGHDAEFLSGDPVGIVIDSTALALEDVVKRKAKKGTKIVALWQEAANAFPEGSAVLTDYHRAAYLATKHLLDLGHERILNVTYRWKYTQLSHRGSSHEGGMQGYSAALAEKGLEGNQKFCFVEDDAAGWESIKDQFVDPSQRPTGVVCYMDFAATHVIRHCRELGLRVPEDIAVVGANNTPWCEWSEVPLTSVSLREDLMARSVAKILKRKTKSPARVVVEPEVIVRESCGYRLASARPKRSRAAKQKKGKSNAS